MSQTAKRHGSSHPVSDVRLRPWQQEAFGVYIDALSRGETSLLWEATPGAGKTTAALVTALHQLKRKGVQRLVVVVPTAHLKVQWARAALRLGLHLDASFSNGRSSLSSDFSGLVVTYHQIALDPPLFRRITKDACIILDEVHHAGDGLAWGDSLRYAFHESRFVLCLSGTPFRSDDNPIPFVTYDKDGFGVADYSYSYSRAVEEGVCRPTAFFTYGGEVSWREEAGDVVVRFSDPLDPMASARRLRAALDAKSGWIDRMLVDAHEMLVKTRKEHPSAGGLIVAADQNSARALSKLLTRITGATPTVVLSDEAEAARKLKTFCDSSDPWLVAVNMVSEGVDIPRLRVGVYATAVRTKMYFRQFLGRIVRRIPDLKCLQVAYCYLPADPGLAQLAAEIENEIRHCIHKKHSRLEDFLNSDGVERGDRERHPPAWESLGAVNEGLDAVIVHGNQLSLFQVHANTDNVVQVVHEKVSERLDERRSRSEEKALLVNDLRRLVGQYHKKTGKTHAQIHTQLNSAQGVRSQQVCTESQLRQRLQFIRRFLSES